MPRIFLAATVILGLQAGQDMPVARLSGGAQGPGTPQSAQGARPGAPLPPLSAMRLEAGDVTLDSARRLTLTFADPRPIAEVVALLTAGTPFSVAVDTDAGGAFRGELKQLTLREALGALLWPLGLDYQVQGHVLRVRRRQVETRLFDLDLLNVQRGLSRTTGDASASVSTSLAPVDAITDVGDGVKALLSERGSMHVDRRAGLVQVTDIAERLDRVGLYLQALQQRSGRQVHLHAQAFEVTLQSAASIDWRLARERAGLPRESIDAGIAADPVSLLAALSQQGEVRVLWTPDVTVLNNEPAIMRLTIPGATSLTLTVVPQISADGIVQMSVSHSWQDQSADGSGPARLSETETVMRIMDGNTAMIAGLQRPRQASGAPARASTELVLLLRPTVVTPGTFTPASR